MPRRHDSRQVEEQLESLFSRCPDLCGFSVRGGDGDLFVLRGRTFARTLH